MLRNRGGYTLVEILIGAAAMAGAAIVGASVYVGATKRAVYANNQSTMKSVEAMLAGIARLQLNNVSPALFNPARTLIGDSSALVMAPAGPAWNFSAGSTLAESAIPSFTLGTFTGKVDSFTLERYQLEQSAAGLISKQTRSLYFSRCLDREATPPTGGYTAAAIQAMRVPVIKAVTRVDPKDPVRKLFCCSPDLSRACPDPTDTDYNLQPLRFWPTIFVVGPDGNVSTIPTDKERDVVFGVALMFSMDRNPPSMGILQTALWYNYCATSDMSGENRGGPDKCAKATLGSTDYTNMRADLRWQFTRNAKSTVQELTGGSMIRIGNVKENN